MSLTDFIALVSEHRLAVAGAGALFLIALRLMLHLPRRKSARPSGWRPAQAARFILVDGSNVMHWRDNIPDIEPVREVIASLKTKGFTPGVVFDANVGYKLEGRYRNHYRLARRIGLPPEQVMVVPKGEPADPMILRAARCARLRRARGVARSLPRLGSGVSRIATPGFPRARRL